MKVIICFGPVRVVVPCGDGEISVEEVMNKAIHRYLKTLDNASDVCVNILNLKTYHDNAILDPGDILRDVVDDKEQLVATFTLAPETSRNHRNGDGMSSSSGGTPSPELFQAFQDYKSRMNDFDPTVEAIVTNQDFVSQDHNLIVRRCSDEFQTITSFSPYYHEKSSSSPIQMSNEMKSHRGSRRKSTNQGTPLKSPNVRGHLHNSMHDELINELASRGQHDDRYKTNSRDASMIQYKTRIVPLKDPDSFKSGSCGSADSYFLSNQNRNIVDEKSNHHHHHRVESPHHHYHRVESPHHHLYDSMNSSKANQFNQLQEKVVSSKDMIGISTPKSTSDNKRIIIELMKGTRGLGFSVTTQDNKTSDKGGFIFVKKILPTGSAIDDGRLQPGDCILEVNAVPMAGRSQEEVVAFLRNIPVGENVIMLVTRATKSVYTPNFSENNLSNKSETKMDLNRNYSKGTSLNDLGRSHKSRCSDNQQDTDSILSTEGDSRNYRARFAREGLGRQSMSEKRKGHMDPRSTETYEKIQTRRSEKKGNSSHSRSDSVDTMLGRRAVNQHNFSSMCEGFLGNFRARTINDSFRAAVEKCLDGGKGTSRQNDDYHDRQEIQKVSHKGFANVLNFGKIKKSADNYKMPLKSPDHVLKASENKGKFHKSPYMWK